MIKGEELSNDYFSTPNKSDPAGSQNEDSSEIKDRCCSFIEKSGENNSFLTNFEIKVHGVKNDLLSTIEKEIKMSSNSVSLERGLLEIKSRAMETTYPRGRIKTVRGSNTYQDILREYDELKQQNEDIKKQTDTVKEQAIEALVEKEQHIIDLNLKLEETERFYKAEIENLFSEIRQLQIRLQDPNMERSSSIFDRDMSLDQKNLELQQKLLHLELELERKETERNEILNQMNNLVTEKVHEKMMEYVSKLQGIESQWIKTTVESMERKDETLQVTERQRNELATRLRNLEEAKNMEISELKEKIIEMNQNYLNECEKLKSNSERQLAMKEVYWLEIIGNLNENIRNKEEDREKTMRRIDYLEKENACLREKNKMYMKKLDIQESYSQIMEDKLKNTIEKHERNLEELESKLTSEKKVLAMELRRFREEEELQNKKLKQEMDNYDSSKGKQTHRKYNRRSVVICRSEIKDQRSSSQFGASDMLVTSLDIELGKSGQTLASQINLKAPSFALNDEFNFGNNTDSEDESPELKSAGYKTNPFLIEERDFLDVSNLSPNKQVNFDIRNNLSERDQLQEQNENLRKELEALRAELESFRSSLKSNKGNTGELQENDREHIFFKTNRLSLGGNLSELDQLVKTHQSRRVVSMDKSALDKNFYKHLKMISSLSHKKGISSLDFAPTAGGTAVSDMEAIANAGLQSVDEQYDLFSEALFSTRLVFTRNLMDSIYEFINEISEFELKDGPKMLSDYQKLKAVLKKMQDLLQSMNEQHTIIVRNLLNKSISKLEGRTLEIIASKGLYNLDLKEIVTKQNKKGKIEYEFEINDKVLQKAWTFSLDYDNLLSLHQRMSKSTTKATLPKFPQKPLLCLISSKAEENFLRSISEDLSAYFSKLIKEKQFQEFLDFTPLRGAIENVAWTDLEKIMDENKETVREWKYIERKIWLDSQKIDINELENLEKMRENTILTFLKEELDKLQRKYHDICADVDLLDQNDTLCILQYEEKEKAKRQID